MRAKTTTKTTTTTTAATIPRDSKDNNKDNNKDEDNDDDALEVISFTYRPRVIHIASRFDKRLSAFTMPVPSLDLLNPGVRRPLEVSALVFNAEHDKVLLLQRAHEPKTWEVPSCGIMDGEKTALHAVVRTVHQCSGQVVHNITRMAGFYEYESSPPWPPSRRHCFVVEVDHPEEEEVALWLELYRSFVWATEEEVRHEERCGVALDFHAPELRWIIQKAFRALREQRQGGTQ